eukprot:CAMPEP_0117480262 /NCGR_PEP_ID=MMETSP0784-20121206/12302_1 /TAXON_ID=39447 /ORGANISM="" /LENGTH=389 /DNA_ID=CAMNT_0005274699 /DNA_START=173 /DNA_END=1342 /DNA_ORIENTATION=+
MPLYEVKVVSPLALRFTQEHIRSTFRDGRDVEAARSQIDVKPGYGGYDLILRAPFPDIEVIRYAPKGGKRGLVGSDDAPDGEDEGEAHWYTFDNRRLYCLQSVAAEHWPKSVAAEVEVVYADPDGSMHRKYDSTSCGSVVSIRRHSGVSAHAKWDWRRAVLTSAAGRDLAAVTAATSKVIGDDAAETRDDLLDVSPDVETGRKAEVSQSPRSQHTEPSTAVASSEGSEEEDDPAELALGGAPGLVRMASGTDSACSAKEVLHGVWAGPRKETYEIDTSRDEKWTAARRSTSGNVKSFTLLFDKAENIVWWGIGYRFFAYVPDAVGGADQASRAPVLKWYGAHDEDLRSPCWTWQKLHGDCPKGGQQGCREGGRKKVIQTRSRWVARQPA